MDSYKYRYFLLGIILLFNLKIYAQDSIRRDVHTNSTFVQERIENETKLMKPELSIRKTQNTDSLEIRDEAFHANSENTYIIIKTNPTTSKRNHKLISPIDKKKDEEEVKEKCQYSM